MPYANGFFDAAISIDSYHYYGANDTYFPEVYAKLVKIGGQFGFAFPGLTREIPDGIPDHLRGIWKDEIDAFDTFHTASWWRQTIMKSGLVDITFCDQVDDARCMWSFWTNWAKQNPGFKDREMLDADTDGLLTLSVLTAKKKEQEN